MKKHLIPLLLLCLLALVGCNKNHPLSGKVTFEDGSPLTNGVVVFDNGTESARGPLQADGSYVVGFGKTGNGIPSGEYKVYITGAMAPADGEGEMKETASATGETETIQGMVTNYVPLIDQKYAAAETSGLTFSSNGSAKKFDITVTKP